MAKTIPEKLFLIFLEDFIGSGLDLLDHASTRIKIV